MATACPKPENAITIAVSSRALFNMDLEQQIFEQKGMEEYLKYQIEHETEPFQPGSAFPFVKALEAVNVQLRQLYPDSEELFDVVLMTNQHVNVGLRLINSVNHHKLFIERFCMTGGNSPIGYLKAYHTNLYLSADSKKVIEALDEGIAAATMFNLEKAAEVSETQLRVAFDGDAVLFSDESEKIFKAHGLDNFFEHEKVHENKPLDHGPLKGFLEALGKLQKKFCAKGQRMDCPIRTYLVTARSAASSGAVRSQTTFTPAVTDTTIIENVTTFSESETAITPIMLSTATPGCSILNTSSCQTCEPGTYYDNETLLCSCCPESGLCIFPRGCRSCSPGFYQPLAEQQTCLSCTPGFYTNLTGSSVCRACPPGSYTNESGSVSCQTCAPGFYASRQSATVCNPCPEGTYCNSSSCAQCQMCPPGSETLKTGTIQCSPCRPGMYKTSHENICEICSNGFYQIHWGQENCVICPEDHYCPSPDVNPIQCPSDAFCPESSTAPGYCMETFFRKAGDTCELSPVTIAIFPL